MNTLILINVTLIIVGIVGFVIWNLMKKVEKLEAMVDVQEKYITDFYELVKQSEIKIKEIDSKQLFQSDDEVGFFFNNLKTIQEALSDYIKFIK
jgi:bifunctional N-acetylglucosamine-1-phosphate-uridyltransferase/glucosamine-1-phosphate-acetyltransferase GlmU-like protein